MVSKQLIKNVGALAIITGVAISFIVLILSGYQAGASESSINQGLKALPAYMKITGESQGEFDSGLTGDHAGEILVDSFSHNIFIPTTPDTGAPTGKRIHKPLTITKTFDKSSPMLYQAMCSGEKLLTVDIKWYRIDPQGAEEHYFTITLQNAIIVSMQGYMPNPSATSVEISTPTYQHMEEVSFTYQKIIWKHVIDAIEFEDDYFNPET